MPVYDPLPDHELFASRFMPHFINLLASSHPWLTVDMAIFSFSFNSNFNFNFNFNINT